MTRLLPLILWWESRTLRERLLLQVLVVVFALWILVIAVWQPLQAARMALSDQIQLHERALVMLQKETPASASVVTRDERPLNVIVTETAATFQLTIRRLEPDGARLRVMLDEVPFDQVILWLEAVERDQGLRIVDLDLTRRPAPGQVNAVLTMER